MMPLLKKMYAQNSVHFRDRNSVMDTGHNCGSPIDRVVDTIMDRTTITVTFDRR